jgi:phage shock protein C
MVCSQALAQARTMNTTASNPQSDITTRPQQLYRPVDDRMLAGVASGIARYLGADVTLVRIVLAVLALVGGAGVPVYLAGWLLIPEEGAQQSIAGELLSSFENRSR